MIFVYNFFYQTNQTKHIYVLSNQKKRQDTFNSHIYLFLGKLSHIHIQVIKGNGKEV